MSVAAARPKPTVAHHHEPKPVQPRVYVDRAPGVIGIVAILIAILLPALRRARDQARLIDCLSRVRQCATIAIGTYASDYRGAILPAVGWRSGFPFTAVGYICLSGSVGYGTHSADGRYNVLFTDFIQMYADPKNQRDNPNFTEYSPILYCPVADYTSLTPPRLGWWGNTEFREHSWRINYGVTPCEPDPAAAGFVRARIGRKAGGVRNASGKVLFVESHYEAVHGATWGCVTAQTPGHGAGVLNSTGQVRYAGPTYTWYSGARHLGGFTAAFCDGSARVIPFGARQEFIAGAGDASGPNWDLDRP